MSLETPEIDSTEVYEQVIEELIKLRIVLCSMLEVMLIFGPTQLTEEAAHQVVMDLFTDLETGD
ncbi:MAG: hypothetical protein AAF544_08570 [Bacteroidota bacterium]